jgi:hypothetical protein
MVPRVFIVAPLFWQVCPWLTGLACHWLPEALRVKREYLEALHISLQYGMRGDECGRFSPSS